MKIGMLSQFTATKVTTIRFYEQRGLLDAPERKSSGHRSYLQSDVERLKFIRNARRLGFSLDEILSLIAFSVAPDQDCTKVAELAAAHLEEVDLRIRQLHALRAELSTLVGDQCVTRSIADCKIIAAIAGCD